MEITYYIALGSSEILKFSNLVSVVAGVVCGCAWCCGQTFIRLLIMTKTDPSNLFKDLENLKPSLSANNQKLIPILTEIFSNFRVEFLSDLDKKTSIVSRPNKGRE